MASYFDVTNADDQKFIPVRLRTYDDLTAVAAMAEADVIEFYTVSTNETPDLVLSDDAVEVADDTFVCLRGYAVDADSASADLKAAMKMAIAALIRWKHAQWELNPMYSVEFKNGMSTSIRESIKNLRSPGFTYHLRRFDLRPLPYVI